MPKKTSKKKTKKKGNPKPDPLFTMTDDGATADGKGKMYCGWVGKHKIGTVVAPNATTARKRLLVIARRMLK